MAAERVFAFDLQDPQGALACCVGIRIPQDPGAVEALGGECLHPEERAFAASLAPLRRRTWIGGRVALRLALERAGLACAAPVLADDRGAPGLPDGLRGSVSHKETIAVALVAGGPGPRLGVDVEVDAERKHDISRRVLTEAEQAEIATLGPRERAREVVVRFSAKEAIYKALDPFVRRYVGFDEVSVTPLAEGGTQVMAKLRHGEGPFEITATWRVIEGLVLTTARVDRIRPPGRQG